jgi:N-acyl-phosphatidylethanolamine-hydrolysing phospholipase D
LTLITADKLYSHLLDWKSHPIPDASLLPTARSPLDDNWGGGKLDELKITWLGHATFLVEFPAPQEEGKEKGTSIRGARVLFDPIFSHRCSPVQFMGPARVTPPPFPLKDLPEVDIVVISHNHYDHLDVQTLKHIYNSQPRGSVHFMVPLGNHDWFTSNGYAAGDVTELDWWEERDCSVSLPAKEGAGTIQTTLRVSCTPCQHFTGRSLTDVSNLNYFDDIELTSLLSMCQRYHTLWASWAVSQPIQSNVLCKSHVWFGGDTG